MCIEPKSGASFIAFPSFSLDVVSRRMGSLANPGKFQPVRSCKIYPGGSFEFLRYDRPSFHSCAIAVAVDTIAIRPRPNYIIKTPPISCRTPPFLASGHRTRSDRSRRNSKLMKLIFSLLLASKNLPESARVSLHVNPVDMTQVYPQDMRTLSHAKRTLGHGVSIVRLLCCETMQTSMPSYPAWRGVVSSFGPPASN